MKYDHGCPKCGYEFITEHGMNEKPIVKCPKCNTITKQLFKTTNVGYIRGYGYMDKEGCHRDMNVHKLMNDDPYASMRQPGEKEELANSIRKGGKVGAKGTKRVAVNGLKK